MLIVFLGGFMEPKVSSSSLSTPNFDANTSIQQAEKKPSLLTRTKSLANLANKAEVKKTENQSEIITQPQVEKTRPTLMRRLSTLSVGKQAVTKSPQDNAPLTSPKSQISENSEKVAKRTNNLVTNFKLNLNTTSPTEEKKISENSLKEAQAKSMINQKQPTKEELKILKEEYKEKIKNLDDKIKTLDISLTRLNKEIEEGLNNFEGSNKDRLQFESMEFKSKDLSTLKGISSDTVAIKNQIQTFAKSKKIHVKYSALERAVGAHTNSENKLKKAEVDFKDAESILKSPATFRLDLPDYNTKVAEQKEKREIRYESAKKNLDIAKKEFEENKLEETEFRLMSQEMEELKPIAKPIGDLDTFMGMKQDYLKDLYSVKEKLNKL